MRHASCIKNLHAIALFISGAIFYSIGERCNSQNHLAYFCSKVINFPRRYLLMQISAHTSGTRELSTSRRNHLFLNPNFGELLCESICGTTCVKFISKGRLRGGSRGQKEVLHTSFVEMYSTWFCTFFPNATKPAERPRNSFTTSKCNCWSVLWRSCPS